MVSHSLLQWTTFVPLNHPEKLSGDRHCGGKAIEMQRGPLQLTQEGWKLADEQTQEAGAREPPCPSAVLTLTYPGWRVPEIKANMLLVPEAACKHSHRSVSKESACNAGDPDLIPGLGRSPGEGKDYPLQCSGLENSRDCMSHGVAKSWRGLSHFHFHKCSLFFFFCDGWKHLFLCYQQE